MGVLVEIAEFVNCATLIVLPLFVQISRKTNKRTG